MDLIFPRCSIQGGPDARDQSPASRTAAPGERAAAERVERFVSLLEREGVRFGPHWHLRGKREKFFPVAPGKIGDRAIVRSCQRSS